MANYREFQDTDAQKAATLTQRIYDTLHQEIVTGQLAPGERLVRRAIARRLGVSPMPVTEALYRLELDGLVESRPLCGCRVRLVTLEELRCDRLVREALECQAARLCTLGADAKQFGALAASAAQLDRVMYEGTSNSSFGMQLHLDFHLELARAAVPHESFVDEIRRIWHRWLSSLNWLNATKFKRNPRDWHSGLVEVLQRGDPIASEQKMREHIHFGSEHDEAVIEAFQQLRATAKAADGES